MIAGIWATFEYQLRIQRAPLSWNKDQEFKVHEPCRYHEPIQAFPRTRVPGLRGARPWYPLKKTCPRTQLAIHRLGDRGGHIPRSASGKVGSCYSMFRSINWPIRRFRPGPWSETNSDPVVFLSAIFPALIVYVRTDGSVLHYAIRGCDIAHLAIRDSTRGATRSSISTLVPC